MYWDENKKAGQQWPNHGWERHKNSIYNRYLIVTWPVNWRLYACKPSQTFIFITNHLINIQSINQIIIYHETHTILPTFIRPLLKTHNILPTFIKDTYYTAHIYWRILARSSNLPPLRYDCEYTQFAPQHRFFHTGTFIMARGQIGRW